MSERWDSVDEIERDMLEVAWAMRETVDAFRESMSVLRAKVEWEVDTKHSPEYQQHERAAYVESLYPTYAGRGKIGAEAAYTAAWARYEEVVEQMLSTPLPRTVLELDPPLETPGRAQDRQQDALTWAQQWRERWNIHAPSRVAAVVKQRQMEPTKDVSRGIAYE